MTDTAEVIDQVRAVHNGSSAPDPVKEAQRKLDDLRAQRVIAELPQPAEELAELELRIVGETELQKAIKEHGKLGQRVHAIRTPLGDIIVKRPTRAAYREYQSSEDRFEGQDVLVHACLVYPDHAAYERIVDQYPAVQGILAGAIALLAGHAMEVAASK